MNKQIMRAMSFLIIQSSGKFLLHNVHATIVNGVCQNAAYGQRFYVKAVTIFLVLGGRWLTKLIMGHAMQTPI